MKKALVIGLAVGILLGFSQIFFVRSTLTKNGYYLGTEACDALTAECGYCSGLKEGNICYTDGFYTRYRGFPLASKSGGDASSVKLGLSLYANMAIFILGTPLLFLILYKLLRRGKKGAKSQTVDESNDTDSSV